MGCSVGQVLPDACKFRDDKVPLVLPACKCVLQEIQEGFCVGCAIAPCPDTLDQLKLLIDPRLPISNVLVREREMPFFHCAIHQPGLHHRLRGGGL